MKFNETFNEFMNLYTEGHMGSAMRNLDRVSGQQDVDELYGAIHAEVQKGKSVEEVLKDMNYAEKNHKVMVNSYNNWLASKPGVEDAEDVNEFFFGYDLENVHPVQEFVKANYDEDEYEMSIGYGDDVMNYLKVNVDLNDEKGKKLLDMIEDCDGEGNFE